MRSKTQSSLTLLAGLSTLLIFSPDASALTASETESDTGTYAIQFAPNRLSSFGSYSSTATTYLEETFTSLDGTTTKTRALQASGTDAQMVFTDMPEGVYTYSGAKTCGQWGQRSGGCSTDGTDVTVTVNYEQKTLGEQIALLSVQTQGLFDWFEGPESEAPEDPIETYRNIPNFYCPDCRGLDHPEVYTFIRTDINHRRNDLHQLAPETLKEGWKNFEFFSITDGESFAIYVYQSGMWSLVGVVGIGLGPGEAVNYDKEELQNKLDELNQKKEEEQEEQDAQSSSGSSGSGGSYAPATSGPGYTEPNFAPDYSQYASCSRCSVTGEHIIPSSNYSYSYSQYYDYYYDYS